MSFIPKDWHNAPSSDTPIDRDGLRDLEQRLAAYADLVAADAVTGLAPISSPTFTGTPAAPTATAGDNSTKIATTAFVTGAVGGGGGGVTALSWTDLALHTGWLDFGGTLYSPQWAKDDYGIVRLRGFAGTSAPTGSPTVAVLPSGARPSRQVLEPAVLSDSSSVLWMVMVKVWPTGEVNLDTVIGGAADMSGGISLYLDGFSFPTIL